MICLSSLARRKHAIGQVRPIEVADEHERIRQGELLADVGPHLLGGRGGVAVHAGAGEQSP